MSDESVHNSLQDGSGGQIPGAPGIAAFRVWADSPSALPVMISVPHAGRAYPISLVREMRYPDVAALKLEDRYVDKLARAVAQQTGAGLLIAQAPRAMIDLNRAPDDIDWEMFDKTARPAQIGVLPSLRVRSGLGLIPRRLPGIGELWRSRLSADVLADRLTHIHEPYHAQLSAMLADLQARWGAALLIDLHSMPPLTPQAGQPPAEFVIGDQFGMTCHGRLVAAAFSKLSDAGRPAAHNRPYAGGYVLKRHARPSLGIHAMQIEIDRSCYLDERMAEPGAGLEDVVAVISDIVRRLAGEIVELSGERSEWGGALAAE